MKLRAKILILLLSAIIPVMLSFAGLAVYFFDFSIKKESTKSHKLMYSLFMPNLETYFWEYDTDSIKATILNIIKNNFATEILVYDVDGSFVTGFVKDEDNESITEIQKNGEVDGDHVLSDLKLNINEITKFVDKEKVDDTPFLISIKSVKNYSKMVGVLYHKKVERKYYDTIGYIVFKYSNKDISQIIIRSVVTILLLSFFITGVLVLIISTLLRKTLIESIIELNNASILIAAGDKAVIQENKGKDEIAELIKNFNIMANQIDQNQENLRIIAEEGVKISSCVTLESMIKQIRDSLGKISKFYVEFDFYISSKFLHESHAEGFIKVILKDESYALDYNNRIAFGDEIQSPLNIRRLSIQDNLFGVVSAVIDIHLTEDQSKQSYLKKISKIYGTLQALKVSTASALSTMTFIREQKEQLRVIGEQETARLVQKNLLPSMDLKKFVQYEIIGYFEPATECAGDWWNTYHLTDGRILILLGDVTGHGISSAIMTAVVKGYCDSLCQNENMSSTEILLRLDKVVLNIGRGERVMTMFAGILDPRNRSIEFANAAHNFPFLLQDGVHGNSIQKLVVRGKPLGFKEHKKDVQEMKFLSESKPVNPGDILFIFSDGLVEATNKEGQEFGDRQLKRILEKYRNKSIVEIREAVLREFRLFTADTQVADDVTFVICKCKY